MRCSKMTEEFMKANPEKYYFNFKEIIVQTLPKSYRENRKRNRICDKCNPFRVGKTQPCYNN